MSTSQQRREDEKAHRRETLIDAAEQVFAARGFDAATLDQVARQARVSRALIYLYFADKAALHFAITERGLRNLRERFQAARAGAKRGIEQVEAIGRAYTRFAGECPVHFEAMSRFEAHPHTPDKVDPAEQAAMEAGFAVHAETVQALEHGVRDGSIAPMENPLLVAITLWGFVHGVIQIAQTKCPVIESMGIPVAQLMEHAIAMAGRTLVPPAGRTA
jgi:AcrR family transcriptional regulator